MIEGLQSNLIPLIPDCKIMAEKVCMLVQNDSSISEETRKLLINAYQEKNCSEADLLAHVLIYAMNRKFKKHIAMPISRHSALLEKKVLGGQVPRSCPYFCGRDKELTTLHKLLTKKHKFFVEGLAGLGKSELVKHYAEKYADNYTDILYINYTGNLRESIVQLRLSDDSSVDPLEQRFFKYDLFLRSLKSDTLLIIDNFNVPAEQDELLPNFLEYGCRILFTTRCHIEDLDHMELREIANHAALLGLLHYFYKNTTEDSILEKIIKRLHSHTLAVELAGRLLQRGTMSPAEMLQELCKRDRAILRAPELLRIFKGREYLKKTYYEHIHLLFSLFQLNEEQQSILRCMPLFPKAGIPQQELPRWLDLPDLNTTNELIDFGFINRDAESNLSIYDMMRDIIIEDLRPCIDSCKTFYESLQLLLVKQDLTVFNVSAILEMTRILLSLEAEHTQGSIDVEEYASFLGTVYQFLDSYGDPKDAASYLATLGSLISTHSSISEMVTATYIMYQSIYRSDDDLYGAISQMEKGLSLLPQLSEKTVDLLGNYYNNLGGLYLKSHRHNDALACFLKGVSLIRQYSSTYYHDYINLVLNLSTALILIGDIQKALSELKNIETALIEEKRQNSEDYARVQGLLGDIDLLCNNKRSAIEHYNTEFNAYKYLWGVDSVKFQKKKDELSQILAAKGILFE